MKTNKRPVKTRVALRLHEPKPKAKPCIKMDNTLNTKPKPKPKQNHKRGASDDEESKDEDKESSVSDDSKAKEKKKKSMKWQRLDTESEVEVEIIEHDIEPPEREAEEVDDGTGKQEPENEGEDDGLNDHQQGARLEEMPIKKDSTLDLLTIMSDKVVVKFKTVPDKFDTVKGRWCNICKSDEHFVKVHGKRKAFHKGGNSSCHAHVCQHYAVYKEKCEVPHKIWRAMEDAKEAKKGAD
ncbi:hypothetical protein BYT27DRAFT_7225171 [Phlegmacium glaucopus]|nr:hypothetical protein BYT27DRAFT_7225171 [Phlegmacium glaucopus]